MHKKAWQHHVNAFHLTSLTSDMHLTVGS